MLWHGHKRDTEELLSVHVFLNSAGETELTISEKKKKKKKKSVNEKNMLETI